LARPGLWRYKKLWRAYLDIPSPFLLAADPKEKDPDLKRHSLGCPSRNPEKTTGLRSFDCSTRRGIQLSQTVFPIKRGIM
jgi:hypothetical protein